MSEPRSEIRDACEEESRARARASGAAAGVGGRLPPVSVALLTTPAEAEWAAASGCPLARLADALCQSGTVEALEAAAGMGAPLTSRACARAAAAGNMRALVWLRGKGVPWDGLTCASAASSRG
jgi:hypothetical protein